MKEHDWSKSHCGVMLCDIKRTIELMPEVEDILDSIVPHLQFEPEEYLVDVKVHMLMPNEYPCIPNWHMDFVPRDCNLKKLHKEISGEHMYIYVSGAPYTEYKSYREKITSNGYNWTVINQKDVHRGIKSEIHTWRCFIRLIPKWFVHGHTTNVGQLRRHSQVYIDNPDNFRW